MILNVSGRTDIVAFYSKWFLNRYKEGYVDVRNPFYDKKVSRIYFQDVDLLFFCTKNPIPILNQLHKIKIPMLFHVTITPYKKDIEPNLPQKTQIIDAVKKLSALIGKENVVVRYDPVFISNRYTLEYHIKAFDKLCKVLDGSVKKILISFLDDYKNVRKNRKILNVKPFTKDDYKAIGTSFSKSAKEHGMLVHTCFEEQNLVEYGFSKGECLSHELAYKLTGKIYKEEWTARKERKCHCVKMVDIGVYNSCKHFCKYCYANYDEKKVLENYSKHIPTSSLLIGTLKDSDDISVRKK